MDRPNRDRRLFWTGYEYPEPKPRVDEVEVARARLVELSGKHHELADMVRQHPLASIAAAFALGMLLAKASTVQALREGIVWGLRGAVVAGLRGMV